MKLVISVSLSLIVGSIGPTVFAQSKASAVRSGRLDAGAIRIPASGLQTATPIESIRSGRPLIAAPRLLAQWNPLASLTASSPPGGLPWVVVAPTQMSMAGKPFGLGAPHGGASLALGGSSPFCQDLLQNGGAEWGTVGGWEFTSGAWYVTTSLPQEGSYCFLANGSAYSRQQYIDLVAAGFDPAVLDRAPTVIAETYFKSADPLTFQYRHFDVSLVNGQIVELADGRISTQDLAPTGSWQKYELRFDGYGSGLRYILFEEQGSSNNTIHLLDGASLRLCDTTAPVLHCPSSYIVVDDRSNGPGEIVNYPPISGFDDIDPNPEFVAVPDSGSFFPRGTTTVQCTLTDASGNQTACSFKVTVAIPPRRR